MAHLGGGCHGASRILADSSAREMHRQQFTFDARLPGVTYGFRERLDNGIRVLEHGGAVSGHTSFIVLAPDERWGLFVACNTGRCAVLQDLVDQLLEHYYGPNKTTLTTLTPPPGFERRARALVGTYRAEVNPRENIEKLRDLFGAFTVTADSGRLHLTSPGGRRTSTWVDTAPAVFQQVGGSGHAAFRRAGPDGPARVVFSARSLPYATFVRQAWYERARCHLLVTTVLLALLVSACTCWPLDALLQRAQCSEGERRLGARLARWNALLVATLLLIFVAGLVHALRGDLMQFMYGVPQPLAGILWIPWVSTALSLPLPVLVVLAWRERYWSGRARVHYTLVTVATAAVVPMLLYWNLLGARL